MYMEDLDLSYRLPRRVGRSWYEPVGDRHARQGRHGRWRAPSRLNWHFHRGMGRFYRQHYAPQRSAAMNALVYVGIAVKLAAAVAQAVLRRSLARRRQRRRTALHSDGGLPSTSGDG